MRTLSIAALLVALAGAPAGAQSVDMVAGDDTCPVPDQDGWCKSSRAQLREAIPAAWKGDYTGQRNVAYCMIFGCDDAVRKDRLLGCAWRIVIVQSGASEVDQSDTLNLESNCADKLTRTERQAAAAKAAVIFRKIYGRRAEPFRW